MTDNKTIEFFSNAEPEDILIHLGFEDAIHVSDPAPSRQVLMLCVVNLLRRNPKLEKRLDMHDMANEAIVKHRQRLAAKLEALEKRVSALDWFKRDNDPGKSEVGFPLSGPGSMMPPPGERILALLGGFRDGMDAASVKAFQGLAEQLKKAGL